MDLSRVLAFELAFNIPFPPVSTASAAPGTPKLQQVYLRVKEVLQPLAVELHRAYQEEAHLQRMSVVDSLTLGALQKQLQTLEAAQQRSAQAKKAFWDAWTIAYDAGLPMWDSYLRYLTT